MDNKDKITSVDLLIVFFCFCKNSRLDLNLTFKGELFLTNSILNTTETCIFQNHEYD